MAAPAAEASPTSSSRVQVKLRAAGRALDRAAENAQDGNAVAVTQLAAVRRNLASGQKTTLRKLTPQTAGAVARAQGHVVSGTARALRRPDRGPGRRCRDDAEGGARRP